jgi:hypothetical protein
MRRASSSVKAITKELAAWEREYMEENTDTLDRVQARMAYPGEPVILENTGELARDADLELEADLAYRFGRALGWPPDVTLDSDYALLLAIGERLDAERDRAEANRVEDAMGYHPQTETPGNAARQRMLELAAAENARARGGAR